VKVTDLSRKADNSTAAAKSLLEQGHTEPVLAVNFKQTKSTCIMADDHCGDSVGPGVARDVVEQAETFVAAMHQIIVRCCAGPVSTIDHGDDQQGRDPQDDLGR